MRVPTYDRSTVAPAALPGVRFDDNAGQGLARSLGRAAHALDEHAARLDEAAVRDADVSANAAIREKLYGAEGFYGKSGRAALDAWPDVEQSLAQIKRDAIGKAGNARQRELLERALGARFESTLNAAAQYRLGQEKVYERETQMAVVGDRTDSMAATYRAGDLDHFNVVRSATRFEALKLAEMQGLDGPAAYRFAEEQVSRGHAMVLADLIDRDPVGARDYLEKYGGEIMERDRATFAPRAEDAAFKVEVARAIDGQPPADLDEVVSFIVDGPEGGMRPVDLDDGAGLTVGGVTAKWHPDLFKDGKTPTRAQVVERLKSYADADVKRLLKEDPALGLAYLDARINQGPDKAAAMLKRAGGDLSAFMDERRKAYAKGDPRFRKGWENRLAQIEARVGGLRENATLSDALALADQIGAGDPQKRETARAMVKARIAEREAVRRDNEARAWDAAQPYVQAGTSWTRWPASIFTALSPQQQTAIKAAEARGESRESDPQTVAGLYELAATSPDAFKAADLTKLLPDLSRSDFEEWSNRQLAARQGTGAWAGEKVTLEATNRVFNLVKPKGMKDADEQAFKASLFKTASDLARAGDKAPTEAELLQLANRLAADVVVGRGLFGRETRPLYEFANPGGSAKDFNRVYDDIPVADRDRLVADYRARFGRAPSKGEVLDRWRALKAAGRL